MMNLRLLQLTLLLLTGTSGYAQKASEKIPFRTYSVSGEINDLLCVTKAGSMKVEVPTGRRSEVMHYRGSGSMVFYRESDQSEGEKIKPLAHTRLPKGISNPLLIFIKMKPSEGSLVSYLIKVIDDDPRKFTDGSLKFVNLTSRTIYLVAGQEGEFKRGFKPGQIVTHKLDSGFKGNLPIKVAFKGAKGVVPVMHSRIFPTLKTRDIYFIWPVANKDSGNKIRISTLRERGDNAQARLKASRSTQ